MGGHSGKAVAAHTRLVGRVGSSAALAVSQAQWALLVKAKNHGPLYLRGSQVRSARVLESLKLVVLRDDGSMTDAWGHVDGERWWLTLAEGVVL